MSRRTLLERLALFVLGGLAIAGAGAFPGGGPAFSALFLLPLVVVCGLVEAAAVRRTGRRHRVASWLPAALGMVVTAFVAIAAGPRGPDSGLADSIVMAVFAVLIPVFALSVLFVTWAALRITPPASA